MNTTNQRRWALAITMFTVGVTPTPVSALSQSRADHREFKTDFSKQTVSFDEI
ncbi:MAG: hypothetical protein IH876_08795, partial [Gemmatimonadetes bacterium]|nr:hypothetical protein [Gemmatimonadota bacterium]